MVRYTLHYKFVQKFPFPARKVYDWSTDFTEQDLPLMGEKGRRNIERIDDSTLVLTDEYERPGGPITKVRLVRLFPERLLWTNTRLSEVGKHSQFIYQIVAEGKGASRLEFYGAQVEDAPKRPSPEKMAQMEKELAETDSKAWVNLAAAIRKDLAASRSRGTSRTPAR